MGKEDGYLKAYEEGYLDGVREGIRRYAWWKDGIQYVGSCGGTLRDALQELERRE